MSTKNTDYVYQGKVYRLVKADDSTDSELVCDDCAFAPEKQNGRRTACFAAPPCGEYGFFKEQA